MRTTAWAIVRESGMIERWITSESNETLAEQLEIYPSQTEAEEVRDIWERRTGDPYKVVRIRITEGKA